MRNHTKHLNVCNSFKERSGKYEKFRFTIFFPFTPLNLVIQWSRSD